MARPRTLSDDEVLRRALDVFWRQGYRATSIPDICNAVGLSPPSVYNTFGSKEKLFTHAIEYYLLEHGKFLDLFADNVRSLGPGPAIQKLLISAIDLYTNADHPRGCAIFNSAGVVGNEKNEGERVVDQFLSRITERIEHVLHRADRHELNRSKAIHLSQYVICLMQGLSRLASTGAGADDLKSIAKIASHVTTNELG